MATDSGKPETAKFESNARAGNCLCGGPATVYDAKPNTLKFSFEQIISRFHPFFLVG